MNVIPLPDYFVKCRTKGVSFCLSIRFPKGIVCHQTQDNPYMVYSLVCWLHRDFTSLCWLCLQTGFQEAVLLTMLNLRVNQSRQVNVHPLSDRNFCLSCLDLDFRNIFSVCVNIHYFLHGICSPISQQYECPVGPRLLLNVSHNVLYG